MRRWQIAIPDCAQETSELFVIRQHITASIRPQRWYKYCLCIVAVYCSVCKWPIVLEGTMFESWMWQCQVGY